MWKQAISNHQGAKDKSVQGSSCKTCEAGFFGSFEALTRLFRASFRVLNTVWSRHEAARKMRTPSWGCPIKPQRFTHPFQLGLEKSAILYNWVEQHTVFGGNAKAHLIVFATQQSDLAFELKLNKRIYQWDYTCSIRSCIMNLQTSTCSSAMWSRKNFLISSINGSGATTPNCSSKTIPRHANQRNVSAYYQSVFVRTIFGNR